MNEYSRRRMAQAVQAMNAQKLDGVIYATGAVFQYLLDWNCYFWQRTCMNNIAGQSASLNAPDAFLYLTREGACTVFMTPQAARRAPAGAEIVVSYMDQFADACGPYLKGKNVGVGFNCFDWLREMLQEAAPELEVVEAEHLLADIRKIKDEKEIRILRENAEFTDRAVAACVETFHTGMTSWEAEQFLMEYGFAHSFEDFSFPPTAGFKTRQTPGAAVPYDYRRDDQLLPGTAVAFDVGYVGQGYCSDWGRTVYWGEAPERIRKAYAALQAGQEHMIQSIVPGKTNIRELYGFVLEKVRELGYGDDLRYQDTGSLGHQIGIDCHEFPMLSYEVDSILQPGMVFCSEPKMFFEGECYMRVEDMILVTETGAESLSKFPRDLFELPVREK